MKSQLRLLCLFIVFVPAVFAAENSNDSYLYRDKCPSGDTPSGYTKAFPGGSIESGYWVPRNPDPKRSGEFWADKWGFAQCNCTSYVVSKLAESFGGASLRNLYVDSAWGNANTWKSVAIAAEIGVTNARSDFVWNASDQWVDGIPPYNGAFHGDVAWWDTDSHGAGGVGHVARVESAQQGAYGRGVECIDVSEYNVVANNYGTRHLCRGDSNFPDAFIHITQDYAYCLGHPSDCPRFIAELRSNRQLAVSGDVLYGFGGSESSGPMPISGGTNSGSLPDLVPYEPSGVENSAKQLVTSFHIGEAGYCRMRVKNVGNKKAGSFSTRCYISDGNKVDDRPRDEGKEDTSNGLSAGSTNTEHEDFVAPKYPGKYNMVFCADDGKRVTELKEGNNCPDKSGEYKFTVWSRPNVSARSLALRGNPASLTPGQAFVADVTLVNAGENIGKTMLVGWYWDGVLSAVDHIQREHFEGGAIKTETWNNGVAPSTPGWHELRVCGNFDGRIENEQNPADDCITRMIEVKVPWDPKAPGTVLWQDDGITPFDLSCGVVSQEPDFTKLPTVQAGDIGAVTVGVNRQRIYIPTANVKGVGKGFWNTPIIDLAKVAKWCWNSNQTNINGWGTDTSKACGVPARQNDGSYVVDILNTPRASKGTWSVRLVGHSGDFWTDVSKWTDKKLDTDGHLRYGGWDFNRMELSVNAEGYSVLTARFGTPGLPGFWLPPGATLTGQAFWHMVGEPGGGIPGNILCDSVTGKLSARIVGATPGSTGRVVLGTTKPNEYAWQGTDWILPADILRGAGEDYLLPNGSVVKSLRLDATYDAGAKRLTLTIPSKQLMPQAFWNAEDISKLTNKAVFQVWVTSGQARFVPGRVAVSDAGVVTIVFEGIERGEGGNVYLVKVDGSQAWQKVGAFGFGSGIVSDPSGWYRMP